jgi:hypothetical protein
MAVPMETFITTLSQAFPPQFPLSETKKKIKWSVSEKRLLEIIKFCIKFSLNTQLLQLFYGSFNNDVSMVDYIGRMMGLMNDELEARSRGLVEDTTEYSTD